MPEVYYGFNRLYIANQSKDILLEFSPLEALSLSAFAKRDALSKKKSEKSLEEMMQALNLNLTNEELSLNQIDLIPDKIEVKDA